MRHTGRVYWVIVSWALLLSVGSALAHITPPVILASDRDAIVAMTSGATKFFVREVRLTAEERQDIDQRWGWQPEDPLYRFYLGRDAGGQLVAAVTFLTEYTLHGPVRVAVGLGPDGKVRDARVVELTEETFPWLKPLIDQNLTQDYVGRDSQASFTLAERFARGHLESMPHFYGQIVVSLIQRAMILFDVTLLKRGGKI
jgi:Na+-translocating ferredoxin:NAD+ oxidoreductase RnfG subunit